MLEYNFFPGLNEARWHLKVLVRGVGCIVQRMRQLGSTGNQLRAPTSLPQWTHLPIAGWPGLHEVAKPELLSEKRVIPVILPVACQRYSVVGNFVTMYRLLAPTVAVACMVPLFIMWRLKIRTSYWRPIVKTFLKDLLSYCRQRCYCRLTLLVTLCTTKLTIKNSQVLCTECICVICLVNIK